MAAVKGFIASLLIRRSPKITRTIKIHKFSLERVVMSGYIFSNRFLGCYDFGFQTIEINNDDTRRSISQLEDIISVSNPCELSNSDFEIYKTYRHEVTHLLDSTATLWGMEYTLRMHRWFNEKNDNNLSVLSLNDAEIQMHNHLLCDLKMNAHHYKINYSLEYNIGCGVFVRFHYLSLKNERIISVPITMLGLLEGHAYAQEQLMAHNVYLKKGDVVSNILLEKQVEMDLKNLSTTEYSCFTALIYQLFPWLSFKKKMELMIFSAKFSLNVPGFMMGAIPLRLLEHIFPSGPADYICSLKMEMSRGMHRSTFCLIVLLYLAMHSETTELITESKGFNDLEKIALDIFPKSIVDVGLETIYELEFNPLIDHLKNIGAFLAENISAQLVGKSWYLVEFEKIYLPSITLSSGEIVTPSNSIDFDVDGHINLMLGSVAELNTKIKEYGVVRQHLRPEIYQDMVSKINGGFNGIVFYPD
ncbi:hypothetical protein [Aeromonas caviae]|uniref:hypothetical protein n=1 Tax=Aeromonas caviae TaxID=648 RepID=UPI0030DA163B